MLDKIKQENLDLLSEEEIQNNYIIQKLHDWQEEYDWVDWKEFKDSWFYCNRCNGYDEGSCICYAR